MMQLQVLILARIQAFLYFRNKNLWFLVDTIWRGKEGRGGGGGGIQPTSPWKVLRFYWIIQIGSNSLLVSDKIKQSLSTNAHLVSPLACDFRCFPVTFNEYLRTSVLQNTCFLKFYFWFILTSEAAVRGFSPKLLFLKISQYSQENTYIYKCQSVKSA